MKTIEGYNSLTQQLIVTLEHDASVLLDLSNKQHLTAVVSIDDEKTKADVELATTASQTSLAQTPATVQSSSHEWKGCFFSLEIHHLMYEHE